VLSVFQRFLQVKKLGLQMRVRHFQNLLYKGLLSLKVYSDNSIMLKAKAYRVQKVHRLKVFKQNFEAWADLHKYYSSIMRESMAKQSLSRVIYLKKFLLAWSDYSSQHKHQRLTFENLNS
jgi:hypothetical protein